MKKLLIDSAVTFLCSFVGGILGGMFIYIACYYGYLFV